MKLAFSAADEAFRDTIQQWLGAHFVGPYAELRYRGYPGDEDAFVPERKAWEQLLAREGWTGLSWPKHHGGQALTLEQQVLFYEEYARVGGPGRLGHIGEGLVAPTLIDLGTPYHHERYLPSILAGQALWCQGYSEPNAGSDLANIQTKAEFDPVRQRWRLTGQKVWTSLAHHADYIFVLARTDRHSTRHQGLGFFLLDLDQPNIHIHPIKQMAGTAEFNEVFLDEAECDAAEIVGEPGQGWSVAMALLGYERGVSTLGQQMQFSNEFAQLVAAAQTSKRAEEPVIRQRIGRLAAQLDIMRNSALRMLSGLANHAELSRAALVFKLYWATLHRDLGELAVDVLGVDGLQVPAQNEPLSPAQRLFLFTRADTIYAGTNEIQRNIIAQRGLGMPKMR